MSTNSPIRVTARLLAAGLALGLALAASQTAALAQDISRSFAWTGGDELRVSVPANIRYTQGPAAQIVVSGPARLVERVELRDGSIRFDRRFNNGREHLEIIVSLPNIRSFSLSGSQNLTIDRYDQADLNVGISGSGKVVASGRARTARASISGSGNIDLGRLALDESSISISGSGSVTAAPKLAAEVSISGSGDVDLLDRAARVSSRVSGSGRVRQGG